MSSLMVIHPGDILRGLVLEPDDSLPVSRGRIGEVMTRGIEEYSKLIVSLTFPDTFPTLSTSWSLLITLPKATN
jgi:hypothetical protein